MTGGNAARPAGWHACVCPMCGLHACLHRLTRGAVGGAYSVLGPAQRDPDLMRRRYRLHALSPSAHLGRAGCRPAAWLHRAQLFADRRVLRGGHGCDDLWRRK